MSTSFDIQPILNKLNELLRADFVPGTLAVVYDDIPKLFSDGVPFSFVEYQGGPNERDNYEGDSYVPDDSQSSTRTWRAELWVAHALLSEIDTADQLTKAFVGTFYEWARQNRTLAGVMGDHGRMSCIDDHIAPIRSLGSTTDVYLANVFTLEFEDFIS
jgi:hypothetical protein